MSDEAERRPAVPKWIGWVGGVIFVAITLARWASNGVTAIDVGLLGFWVASAAGLYLASNNPRPRRTYYYIVLASLTLAALLVLMPFAEGISILPGAIMWAGVSALIAIWGVYYERTER